MASVKILGHGVASYCCAHLLQQSGARVSIEPVQGHSRHPRLPAILMSSRALDLIRDVFGRKDLLPEQPRIRKRVIAWGPRSAPRTFEHSAVVVSEQSLLDAIRPILPPDGDGNAGWTIFSSPPLPAPAAVHRFGSRVASAAPVILKAGCEEADYEPAACWIESLETGWLFLIADTPASGWILAVGAPPESLLGRSRVIAPQIVACGAPVGEFPASPRIASQLCVQGLEGAGWLGCGTAAMAFDPLSGDGAAHSIREAILAAAVIRAIDHGGNVEDLLAHYEARMIAAFERHLALCLQFYRTGHGGEWWDSECRALEQGLDWCRRQTGNRGHFRYRLNGFDLQPVGG